MTDDDTTADTEGEQLVAAAPVTASYKVLGQFVDSAGAAVLGQNDAGSGTPIGVQGAVPNEADGYGLATPDDARIEGAIDTNETAFRVEAGANASGSARNVVLGHASNDVAGVDAATISGGGLGGAPHTVSGDYGTVGGGQANTAGGNSAVVAGGAANDATGKQGTVGGGSSNGATAEYATVAGGWRNDADTYGTTVAGGANNTATSGSSATVSGGSENTASADYATVSGGRKNDALGAQATVSGGELNEATGGYTAVAGGEDNLASGSHATVAGGTDNEAGADSATVSGGTSNTALSIDATVGGGRNNEASGSQSTVVGGANNVASGSNAVAAGRAAVAENNQAFVYNDNTPHHDTDGDSVLDGFSSAKDIAGSGVTGADTFHVSAQGGARFVTGTNSVTYIAGGSTGWSQTSSRAAKTDLEPVDPPEVLDSVRSLELTTWEYTDDDGGGQGVRHVGPMAEQFHDALPFDVGDSERHLNSINVDGVALAAIQGLAERLEARDERIDDLEAENERLRERNEELAARLDAVEARLDSWHTE